MDDQGIEEYGLSEEELVTGRHRVAGTGGMSTIRGGLSSTIDNFAMPINEAIAINNESVSSIAIADADQIVILDQTAIDDGGT